MPFAGDCAASALVVWDKAPVQTSAAVAARREAWEDKGLYLLSLPPYCPELNLIEHLWRKIKYEWLPLCASESFARLTEELFAILKGIGSKYRITFAQLDYIQSCGSCGITKCVS